MADTKFSDFAAGTEVANADQLVGLQGGANVRVTKTMILTGATGENIAFKSAGGFAVSLLTDSALASFELDDSGTATLNADGGFIAQNVAGNWRLQGDSVGNVVLQCAAGKVISIREEGSTSEIQLDGSSDMILLLAAGGVSASYVSAVPGDWDGGSPPTFENALDRLATAVAGLLGTPVPS